MRLYALMAVTFKITLLWDVMHLPDIQTASHPEDGYLQNFTTSTYKYIFK